MTAVCPATGQAVGLIAPRFIQDVGTGANLRHRIHRETTRDIEMLVTYDTTV